MKSSPFAMSHEQPQQPEQPLSGDHQRQFLRLLSVHQRRIYAYLFTLIPNRDDAEDLLQEVLIALWDKFDQYDPERDFMAWALKFAYLHACNARRKYARSPLVFSDMLLTSLADETAQAVEQLDQRHDALQNCLHKLPDRERELILSRYESDVSVKRLAERLDQPVTKVYKRLARIRRDLLDCVNLALNGGTS